MSSNNGNRPLDKQAIFGISDLITQKVEVPQWGGYVLIRSLTTKERGRLELSIHERKGVNVAENLALLRSRMVMLSVVNEEGARMFDDRDIERLEEKSAAAMDLIFTAAMRLSGITKSDVDELTKNSEPAQTADFASA
jgi:hypothetical protein